ncbi:response regulator transcription factor [Catellatospora chokoriensis]|uniref:Response regulatory domain-containing protein n=1 Tax=Catellatospora chokoriensis TaxID=310353 RepID=A0A8J3NTB2_9ACTN|nr:response regulator [Catellatospora chokoriensis]GIF91526.1 hypothetical protein Cch02nite_49700 [Catellatospora chokoriensis]
MSNKVLLVDDNAEFARRAAELVSARTGLETSYATTPEDAIGHVEQHPIAVVVMDQKMPRMSGTDLFAVLYRMNPQLRGIMLSGEADGPEVGLAFKIGYRDHLEKGRISELPDRVLVQYVRYLASNGADRQAAGDIIWPRPWYRRILVTTSIRLLSAIELEPRVLAPDGWVTVLTLQSGEEQVLRYEASRSESRTMEAESQRVLKSVLNVGPKAFADVLSSVLEASATTTLRNTQAISRTTVRSSERTLSLPQPPLQDDPLHVRARHFQQAVVYRKSLLTLEARCRRCPISERIPVVVFEDTGQLATRHCDRLNTGEERIVDTGYITLSEPSTL